MDLVFLDIKMPDISGLDWLRGLDQPPLVIFTTAYSEFAAESYELEAVDYWSNPLGLTDFSKPLTALLGYRRPSVTPTRLSKAAPSTAE